MKRYLPLQLSLLIFLSIHLTNCSCGNQREAELSLIFVNEAGDTLASPYQRIYGLGGNGDAFMRDDQTYLFVLSVVKDTVIYVMESISQPNDTLAVSYNRDFRYRSDRCGFEVSFGFPRLIDTLNTFDPSQIEILTYTTEGERREITKGYIKVLLP